MQNKSVQTKKKKSAFQVDLSNFLQQLEALYSQDLGKKLDITSSNAYI